MLVTNTGGSALTVAPVVQALGLPTKVVSTTVNLNPLSAPTFVDGFGVLRGYVEQDFTVPAGAQRLDAAVGWNITGQASSSPVRLTLFDSQGRFAAFSKRLACRLQRRSRSSAPAPPPRTSLWIRA